MLILLTNDDGINSPVMPVLKAALDGVAETILFAPDHNWSASGHPKTMHKPLRADPIEWPDGSVAYKSSGAPPDCVALAMLGVIDRTPDMVVSGINLGANLGYDLFYSGTVAAAVEGVINGLPALAFSRVYPFADEDFSGQAAFAAKLARLVLERGLPADTFLNVNFPRAAWADVRGVHITRLGRRVYQDELVARQDPRGRPYYWIGGHPPTGVPDYGTDIWAVENDLISITPISLDITAHRMIEELKRWHIEDL
ncbi:MAG: 5'/3'-nucleotidase SurE [Caldilineae bacterium]|nr:MAG: 5'/3'-nucleotidase SurE [Caldilineae bacterium]